MNFEQKALEFTQRLQTLYFEQRDLSALLSAMDENISWVDTGGQKCCRNLEEVQARLSLESQECSGHITIIDSNYDTMCPSEDVCVVYGTFTARSNDTNLTGVHNRITAVCVLREGDIKLAHLHLSTLDTDHGDGQFNVKCDEDEQKEKLRLREEKDARELRLSLEQYKIIMDQTTDIIFEWDIRADTLTFSSNWRKKFGYDPIRESISQKIPQSLNIHPEDMPAFVKIMRDTAAGVSYSEAEFRIRDIWGDFTWSRIRATVQYDLYRKPVKAVGVISDIDVDKKQKQRLLEQARRDPLTNLYNKTAVRELAERKMQEGGNGEYQALFIIDVDNFKHVNDTYGHLCGDSLLSDVGGVLKSNFRADDIVGRIGGDEFLVYLPKIAGRKQAEEKAEEVLNALRQLRPMEAAPPITCSIGVAISQQKASDYFALYQCADMALYYIKAQGRNNFAFYDPKVCNGQIPCGLSKSAVGAIDAEVMLSDAVGQQLIQYTFQMLYDSIDVKTAVGHLLEIVGRAYDVSRVYIFESTEDGQRCNNTFEWCNTGVTSEIDHLQNIDYMEDLGNYLQNFNDNHIFYCRDIGGLHPDLYSMLAAQGICSLLQCAIMDDGIFKGYVGFDECRENRSWTKEQVGSLTIIANVLSTFLLKERLKERLSCKKR